METCARCDDIVHRGVAGGRTSYLKSMTFNKVSQRVFWHKLSKNDIYID